MCYVYILYSFELDKYYVGHTCDTIKERMRMHLSNHSGFTSKTKDWIVVYSEPYTDKSTAYRREREIKAWKSRRLIVALIETSE
ncbi:MAG TPA: GIY-YIG nuclease family protein [Flavobacteriaceae bacterium]|nr:GIY-YIG nuclease family protein [Flavobacteriaceae bacterium]